MNKAYVTQVPFGNTEVEGLMDERGDYYVAVPQIDELTRFSGNHRNASQSLKRILSNGSLATIEFIKLKTEFNAQPVNCVRLPDFEKILAKLDRNGNKKAQELRDALVGLSLHQLFSDAFGVKFEAEDRQKWLATRLTHKQGYQPRFCIWGKVDGLKSGGKEYGARMNRLKAQLDLPLESIDTYNFEQLSKLNSGEYAYDLLRKSGMSHDNAINLVR